MHRFEPLRILSLTIAAAWLSGCATLPLPEGRVPTSAVLETGDTRLGRALARVTAAHPGRTGVHPLVRPRDAFATRMLLAAAAERSLDVQYYIWRDDQTGRLLFEALWNAAERGVRVRLLLDDINTAGLDSTLAALDAHPQIEVRLYNPLAQRTLRALNFVTDFTRVNRRMHNKSFTADNQVAVVGGRNIGNEYFAAGDGLVFADLDVALVGAAVPAVSRQFDRYWNSPSAYPAAQLIAPDADARALPATFAATRADAAAVEYIEAVRATPLVRELLDGVLKFEWTAAEIVSDDPAKTLDRAARTELLLFPELVRTVGRPRQAFDLVTPYFVPGREGTDALVRLAHDGVAVRILTNSLAASDVSAVHSGYARRREDLLRGGVRLYELKPTAIGDENDSGTVGSSTSSGLHAKTFAVDGTRVFVGSFNFDQRSAKLNTEMGVVIDSAALAQQLGAAFDHHVQQIAYEVRLGPDSGRLQWIERTPSGERRHDTEPGTGWWGRLKVQLLSVLPIEWLL